MRHKPTPSASASRSTREDKLAHAKAVIWFHKHRLNMNQPNAGAKRNMKSTTSAQPAGAIPAPTAKPTAPDRPGSPMLRLTEPMSDEPIRPQRRDPADAGEPIIDFADPRWVLAVRTGESLEGPILTADKRERLLMLGKQMGLSPFDANLIIAMVQDQARRGQPAEMCAELAEPQLMMIRKPSSHVDTAKLPAGRRRGNTARATAILLGVFILVEVALLSYLLPW